MHADMCIYKKNLNKYDIIFTDWFTDIDLVHQNKHAFGFNVSI